MSKSPNHRDDFPTPPSKSTAVLLLRDIADTTWRMFIPTIGITLLGVYADTQFDSLPWGTIAGIILGCTVTALLVRKQFKKL